MLCHLTTQKTVELILIKFCVDVWARPNSGFVLFMREGIWMKEFTKWKSTAYSKPNAPELSRTVEVSWRCSSPRKLTPVSRGRVEVLCGSVKRCTRCRHLTRSACQQATGSGCRCVRLMFRFSTTPAMPQCHFTVGDINLFLTSHRRVLRFNYLVQSEHRTDSNNRVTIKSRIQHQESVCFDFQEYESSAMD
jgi:hypothetical protein